MEQEKTIAYSNDDLTVLWKPQLCIHSKHCWKELGDVFKPSERPWVNMKGASSRLIREQVDKCPSGALSYQKKTNVVTNADIPATPLVEVTPNGPLLVHGHIVIKDASGNQTAREKTTALCRCGHSLNKPYCDGNHTKKGFTG